MPGKPQFSIQHSTFNISPLGIATPPGSFISDMPRPLVVALVALLTLPLAANEVSVRTLQSGSPSGTTPLHNRGLHGEGQVIAVLDTGLDYDSCYFAEPDGRVPPINTGTPSGGFEWRNVDTTRRKVIAYDFLYSCAQFPAASGCDDPTNVRAWDNQGHGTHAAASAAADRGTPIVHDFADAIATGAKLVIQDAGYIGGDNCSQRPGIGCPVQLTPIFEQAYLQGARIHSNSWGDRQGTPPQLPSPTANYPQSARDVDAFVWSHPDFLVVFNTGNFGTTATPPASTLSAPGSAKNTIQVGGTRGDAGSSDETLAQYTLIGPTRDGRIKPDLVGPAFVLAGDTDLRVDTKNCDTSYQPGTSWASPTIAGAAALVRQYYTDGFYPSGSPIATQKFIPSAALLKATMIAAARQVTVRATSAGYTDAQPVPSYEQGFGFPVLDDALYFPGDKRSLKVIDVPLASGLGATQSATTRVNVRAGTPLKAVLVWSDPPGTVSGTTSTTPQLVNDLDLRVTAPAGATTFGNERLHPGQPDRLNNVEVVTLPNPAAGSYSITVSVNRLGFNDRQSYALVITGDLVEEPAPVLRRRAARP
jgi:hypothetical protein